MRGVSNDGEPGECKSSDVRRRLAVHCSFVERYLPHPRNISVFVAISHFCVRDVLADYFGLPHDDIFVVTRRARQLPARRVDRLARELSNRQIKKMTIVRERFAWNYEDKITKAHRAKRRQLHLVN
jgi:hypothetical protein